MSASLAIVANWHWRLKFEAWAAPVLWELQGHEQEPQGQELQVREPQEQEEVEQVEKAVDLEVAFAPSLSICQM